MAFTRQTLGHGIGLRATHFDSYLATRVPVGFVEAISENFIGVGGRIGAVLEKVRRDVPVALHGVALGIGGTGPLNKKYLGSLKALVDQVEPAIVSDHLCWGAHRGRYVHDLLPLPFTEESLANVVRRVKKVQDGLGRQILLENVSSYLEYQASTLTEWDFLAEVARRADCGILLDVNNIYVSAKNHRFDPRLFLDGIPVDRVGQIHLAGHRDEGAYLFDTHDHPVCDAVWELYDATVRRFGAVSTLIEWDDQIPPLPRLLAESRRAQEVEAAALGAVAPRRAGGMR
jgi:uncharacterized protein